MAQNVGRTIGQAQNAAHKHFHADGVQIFHLWFLCVRCTLGHDHDEVVAADGGFDRLDGAVAPDDEGRHGMGKDDGVPKGKQRVVAREAASRPHR